MGAVDDADDLVRRRGRAKTGVAWMGSAGHSRPPIGARCRERSGRLNRFGDMGGAGDGFLADRRSRRNIFFHKPVAFIKCLTTPLALSSSAGVFLRSYVKHALKRGVMSCLRER
jgi:hypothetical protein